MDERAQLKAAGFSDAEIDAYLAAKGGAPTPMERAPDGPFAQSREVPNAKPAPRALSGAGELLLGANQVLRGVTGGLSDRAMAGIAALGPGVTYADARKTLDDANQQFGAQHPVAAPALNVVGALIPTPMSLGTGVAKGAKWLNTATKGFSPVARGAAKVAGGAVGGAVAGGAGAVGYQTGEDDRSLGAGARNFATGALAGGVLGGVLPAAKALGSAGADLLGLRSFGAPTAVGTVPQATSNWLDKLGLPYVDQFSMRADQKVRDAVTRGGRDVLDGVAADVRYDNVLSGNKSMVADRGGIRGMKLARGAKVVSEDAAEALDEAFTARDNALGKDMRQVIGETVGGTNTVKAGKALKEQAAAQSTPLYDKVRAEVVTLSPASREVFESRDPRGLFRAAHRIARDLAREEGRKLSPLFVKLDDGTRRLRSELTIEEIDYMKRGIQELADKGLNGKSISRARARSMLKNLETVVGDADAQVSGYPKARQAFAAPMQRRDALKTAMAGGKKFGSPDQMKSFASASPDEIADFTQGLGDGPREFYEMGVGSTLGRSAARDPRKLVRDLGSTTKTDLQEKVRAGVKTQSDVDELVEVANVRNAQTRRQNAVMSGSPTADKMNEGLAAQVPAKGGQLRYAPARAIADMLMGQSLYGMQGKTASEVGKRMALSGTNAEDYLRHLLSLDEYLASRGANRTRAGANSLAALLGYGSN